MRCFFHLLYTCCIFFHLSMHMGIGVTWFEQRQVEMPAYQLLRLWHQHSLSWAARRKIHVAGILPLNCHPLRHQGSRTPALHWHPLIIPAGHAQLPAHSGLLTSVPSLKASNADGVSRILILQVAAHLRDTFQCNQGLWSHPEFSK